MSIIKCISNIRRRAEERYPVGSERMQRKVSIIHEEADGGDVMVHSPPHYQQGKVQIIDAIDAVTTGYSGIEAVDVAHVVRYLSRAPFKGSKVQDIHKARWYLQHLIDQLEE